MIGSSRHTVHRRDRANLTPAAVDEGDVKLKCETRGVGPCGVKRASHRHVQARLDLGVRALATTPRRSRKRDTGETDLQVTFAGVTFTPGEWVYADEDGILVLPAQAV